MKDKIRRFQNSYQEKKEISENMLSVDDRLAKEIIDGLIELIEEQDKANRQALEAIGDYGTVKTLDEDAFFGKKGTTKSIPNFVNYLFDKDTSIEKQLENTFYQLQKTINKKIKNYD